MCPNSAQVMLGAAISALLAQAWTALLALAGMGPDQQKRPRPEPGALLSRLSESNR